MIQFVKPVVTDVLQIASTMRPADQAEVWASHRYSPRSALMHSWDNSDFSVVVRHDDEPVAMYGLIILSKLTGAGIPWLLASQSAMNCKREFLIQSPPVINEMLSICPRLFNYVHADNRVSVKWLRWLGFTIGQAEPHGVSGELFHRFHLEKSDV